jgi:hypothetical protein
MYISTRPQQIFISPHTCIQSDGILFFLELNMYRMRIIDIEIKTNKLKISLLFFLKCYFVLFVHEHICSL